MPAGSKVVAYTDLLGFSDLVVNDSEMARELLSQFYNKAQRTKIGNGFDELELFLFSDFLFVQGDDVSLVINYVCELYREALKYSKKSDHPMLCRGGVARGEVLTQQRNTAPKVTKNFIVSPALAHAVKMEGLVKGQRLLLAANEKEQLSHFWNPQVHAICYDQPSILPGKLFQTYRYQDLLWARDLGKTRSDAKIETRNLIRIASKLLEENLQPKNVRAHYAETLRICLLSYSDLIAPCSDDRKLLSDIVDILVKFPNESTWLGFVEMVFLSKHKLIQLDQSVFRFLKFALTSPRWGAVCTLFERQENHQLVSEFHDFLAQSLVMNE